MSIQGQTATNKDNNISKFIDFNYCNISPNMANGTKLAQKTPSHTSAINKVSYHFNIPISNQIFFNSIEVEFCLEDVWLVTGDNGGGRLLRVDDFSEPA